MSASPPDEQRRLYRLAFVRNCLILIALAHKRMAGHSLQHAEEPHITGELVKGAKLLLESQDAKPWMEHIEVLDDPPQDAPNRYGKNRPRIDIEVVTTGRGRRPRVQFEAKRLYRSDSASEYFGFEGLQMFVDGSYASEWPSAGMLGYVQTDNCERWIERLGKSLASRRTETACVGALHWEPATWSDEGLETVRVSKHRRTDDLGTIEIFHLLLDFVLKP